MFPKLVRNPKTPVQVVIRQEDVNEFGERPVILNKTFMCHYQDSGAVKYTTEKQSTEVTGTIYIDGDILDSPEVSNSEFGITESGTLMLVSTTDKDGTLVRSDHGDVVPNIMASGYVVVFGHKQNISKVTKARNLDGSVNYTKIEVI